MYKKYKQAFFSFKKKIKVFFLYNTPFLNFKTGFYHFTYHSALICNIHNNILSLLLNQQLIPLTYSKKQILFFYPHINFACIKEKVNKDCFKIVLL